MNIYLGKQTELDKREIQIGKKAVLALCGKFFNTNRCLCADKYFSSISLCAELWEKGIQYVGTLRANKSQIPQAFLKDPSRTLNSLLFAFKNDLTVGSFVPKTKQSSSCCINNASFKRNRFDFQKTTNDP